jgi:hypothetical protein
MASKLAFQRGNAKLVDVYTLALPAGWSCPFALHCLARADRATGHLTDGPAVQFRCHEASIEAVRPNVRDSRWRNWELLRAAKTAPRMAQLLTDSLPRRARKVRFDVAGDFFSQAYFDAWLLVARAHPDRLFYGYTKSLPYWIARLGQIPGNMVLTASRGGRHDALIAHYGLRSSRVVFSEADAAGLGLPIDHDDSHAQQPGGDFALLLHGVQPKGSPAAAALKVLKANGWRGYTRRAA